MAISEREKRKLIKEYFECLRKRNRTKEAIFKRIMGDLFSHWKEQRMPKEAWYAYGAIVTLLISLLIDPGFTLLLIVVGFFLAKIKVSPNIRPKVTDAQIDQWQLEDRRQLFDTTPDRLNVIQVSSHQNVPMAAQNVVKDQIRLISGYTLNKNSSLLEFLDIEDCYAEKGLDGKIRYSIHVLMVIYLCNNFLNYFKCYWNSIKGVSTFIETSEHLYDLVVSVTTRESSSAALINSDGKKVVLSEYLVIGTADGKTVDFPYIIDVRLSEESNWERDSKQSAVSNAAKKIRTLLRQRRIDV
ncbi:hypothetical protein [Spirulina sp. 06S082]|uniref:hypothetical protein n=1 Tax=Spirulina sp. 06S082 TaxID=3110248 RepID=UPI002B211CA2|nr:hypothetical protein [Spirulina sp. 06S082]MEA5470388.1 hypothetical protein [Spirulina sp. 06S082]